MGSEGRKMSDRISFLDVAGLELEMGEQGIVRNVKGERESSLWRTVKALKRPSVRLG